MDGSESDTPARGPLLLSQLDYIFATDPLIDELGFVHPSEITSLHSPDDTATSDVPLPKLETLVSTGSSTGEDESHSHGDCSRKPELRVDGLDDQGTSYEDDGLPYDSTAFWCGEHKLAISMVALAPMYKSAKAGFLLTRTNYKKLVEKNQGSSMSEHKATGGTCDSLVESSGDMQAWPEKVRLEGALMKYSRALVLINCDHASAWNSRKQILLSSAASQQALAEELHLAGLVLSCGPKSEETWAHRRWVINQMIAGGVPQSELDSLLEAESELVESVTGRSLMNYRAWHHRCWLVSQMSFEQVAVELHRTKLWAASHVSDNCCFHYRRCLLLQLFESKAVKSVQVDYSRVTAVEKEIDMRSLQVALLDGSKTIVLWKEEMNWIKNLVQQFIGREALWIHLRFLSFCWVCHMGPILSRSREGAFREAKEPLPSIESEQDFVDCCLSSCRSNLTEEKDRQREFAAAYKLWVFMLGSRQHKEAKKNGGCMTYTEEFNSLEQVLHDVAPHRKQLWEGLLHNFQHT